jgi:adenosylcobinamide-GDP ribazoletransferase
VTALRGARAAFVFLTRIPVGGHPYDAAAWRWAPAHFPLVGLVLGALLGALHRALWPVGALGDAALVLGASLLLTGAMHEDGLADTADALGGGMTPERVLEILKDSRVGVYGACALLVSLVGRAALLARIGRDAAWALPLVGCAARVGPVWQMLALRYVTGAGAKSRDVAGARLPQAIGATLWLAVACAIAVLCGVLDVRRLAVLLGALAAVVAATAWRYRRRVGGVTGDFLGATEQLGEIAAYAVLAWDGGHDGLR